jgi:hypothetical protein
MERSRRVSCRTGEDLDNVADDISQFSKTTSEQCLDDVLNLMEGGLKVFKVNEDTSNLPID